MRLLKGLMAVMVIMLTSGVNARMESENGMTVQLKVGSPRVLVTNVVPVDHEGTIKSWELDAVDGKVTLNLTADPLVIEESTEPQIHKSSPHEDSPFGFHPAWTRFREDDTWEDRYRDALNIGIRWERCHIYIHWPFVQTSKEEINNGVYHWDRYDRQFGLASEAGINILANIAHVWSPQATSPYAKPNSWLPFDENAYYKFVKTAVERYDGDRIDDAPGNIKIRYWQIENEPNFHREKSAESYAQLLKIAYQAIKEADPEAKVLIGGCGAPEITGWIFDERTSGWYEKVLRELDGRYMDVFDWHFYGNATGDYKRLGYVIPTVREMLDRYGFKHVPIWITEMGTYSGTLNKGGRPDPATFQNEDAQARDVVKRYVYSLSLGVKKIFMAFGLVEGFKGGDGYFDHTGFIYDGVGNDDRGSGVKKKAYYAYKVMTSKLEGSDWNSVESVDLGKEDTYAFKFLRNGKPIYVVWWDHYEDELALVQEKIRQFEEKQKKERGRTQLITAGAILGAIVAFTGGTYLILKRYKGIKNFKTGWQRLDRLMAIP